MKKLSIEQKQLVYGFLLEKGVPDLYAALIAERQIYPIGQSLCTVERLLGGLDWTNSPEGFGFWDRLDCEMECHLPEFYQNKVDIVLEDKPEVVDYTVGDVVKSSAGEDFIAIGTNFNLDKEIETAKGDGFFDAQLEELNNEVFGYVEEPYRPQQPQEYLDYLNKMNELTFWQKIKFYAGRLFFKV